MKKVLLIPGDGIGPEIMAGTKRVLVHIGGLDLAEANAGAAVLEEEGALVPEAVHAAIEGADAVLKGPITTPVGSGFRSVNVMLRKYYDLYVNQRPARSFKGLAGRYDGVDLVIFRENTEGLYLGIEKEIPGGAEAIKRITHKGSERIIRAAFEHAVKTGRKRVTCVHKANILKDTDGLFLNVFRKISAEYPALVADDLIVDNCCMQLVMRPEAFDVLVTMNLYGDILSDLAAGLIGGLGLIPGANIGDGVAIFEAVHGSAPDIAGKGVANPTALLLSAAMMLDYLEMTDEGDRLRAALDRVIEKGEDLTPDLGGAGTTERFIDAVLSEFKQVTT